MSIGLARSASLASALRTLRLLLVLVAGGSGWTPGRLSSQAMPRPATPEGWTDTLPYRVPVFYPTSGPPGTRVRVEAAGLPAITPVYITMAGTRSGFEVIAQALTDRTGRVVETVEVPSWVTYDRSHGFIVMDFYFRPIAFSELFRVTTADGLVRRQGDLREERPGCLVLAAEDGVYTLTGETAGLAAGGDAVVEGSLAAPAPCREGPSIRVVRVQGRDPSR